MCCFNGCVGFHVHCGFHASDVDVMNEKLRQCFIELYREPILEDLEKSLLLRYPGVKFPPLPSTGELELEKVLESDYFFN